MTYRAITRAIVEKNIILQKRYWLNTAVGLLITFVLFMMVVFGGRSVAPGAIEGNLSTIIVGFFVWTMAFGAFQDPANNMMNEAQWGTLEQLYMTPIGITNLLFIRTIIGLLIIPFIGGTVLLAMMVTTGEFLHVDFITVVPLSILTIASATGIGFALGGLALVYKRISNIFLIIQFLLIGAIAAPSDQAAYQVLPLTLGVDLIQVAMKDGARLWELPHTSVLALAIHAMVYLGIGLYIFIRMVRMAKAKGVMGHY